jgi:putative PIN family toxin of toxin-antitoxin system
MDELEGVLAKSFSLDGAFVRSVRAELELIAEVVRAPEVSRVARDPDDDAVLAAAVVGGVAMIVTGDGDLLALGEHHGIRIVTPRDFASGV